MRPTGWWSAEAGPESATAHCLEHPGTRGLRHGARQSAGTSGSSEALRRSGGLRVSPARSADLGTACRYPLTDERVQRRVGEISALFATSASVLVSVGIGQCSSAATAAVARRLWRSCRNPLWRDDMSLTWRRWAWWAFAPPSRSTVWTGRRSAAAARHRGRPRGRPWPWLPAPAAGPRAAVYAPGGRARLAVVLVVSSGRPNTARRLPRICGAGPGWVSGRAPRWPRQLGRTWCEWAWACVPPDFACSRGADSHYLGVSVTGLHSLSNGPGTRALDLARAWHVSSRPGPDVAVLTRGEGLATTRACVPWRRDFRRPGNREALPTLPAAW